MTPSGVPPMPKRMSAPELGQPVAIAPATSPSVIEMHARAGLADLGDQVVVARAVQDHDAELLDGLLEPRRELLEVLGRGRVDVDRAAPARPDGDLLHVDDRAGVEHRAALGQRDHRHRAVAAHRGERRAVDRVDGDVDLRAGGRRRSARRCRASARRPSRPRRSRRSPSIATAPSTKRIASTAAGRRRSCRRARTSARPRWRRPRSRGSVRARGCGPAAAAGCTREALLRAGRRPRRGRCGHRPYLTGDLARRQARRTARGHGRGARGQERGAQGDGRVPAGQRRAPS